MTSMGTLAYLLSPEQRKADERAERRARFIQVAVIAILLIIVGTWVWGAVIVFRRPKIDTVNISNAHVVSESTLCPGDMLILAYNLHAEGAGKLVESATAWRETPPKTIVYSEERHFLLEGTIEQETTLAWPIPISYTNPATAQLEPLPPGEYRRIFSVSSVSRPSTFTMASVGFQIKSDCE